MRSGKTLQGKEESKPFRKLTAKTGQGLAVKGQNLFQILKTTREPSRNPPETSLHRSGGFSFCLLILCLFLHSYFQNIP